jgi:hypothetical protein
MTTSDAQRRNVKDWQVRVVDHGAHRRVNRYEVTLCNRHDDSAYSLGWHDRPRHANAHADRLRATFFGPGAELITMPIRLRRAR